MLRTQQTFYLSFLNRLPNTKVLVIDQLNERRFHPWFDAHNFEISREDTKKKFKDFIKKLNEIDWKKYIGKTLKFPKKSWDDIFEEHQYQGNFWELIEDLTKNMNGNINIFCVSSHHRIQNLIKEKFPNTNFEGKQVLNCEIIKVSNKVERLWPCSYHQNYNLIYFEPWNKFLFLHEYMRQDIKGKQNTPLQNLKKYNWNKVKKYLVKNKKLFPKSLINYDFYLQKTKPIKSSNKNVINFLFLFGSPDTKKIEYEFKEFP